MSMPTTRSLLLLCTYAVGVGATSLSAMRPLRIRGGEADNAPPSPSLTEKVALSKEEIIRKLNNVPVFCVLNADDGVVGTRAPDGDKPVCTWFADSAEARAVLEIMQKANPEIAGLHLGVHGLGNAFTMCNGWGDEDGPTMGELKHTGDGPAPKVSMRLQANRGLLKQVAPQLEGILKGDGVDPGSWLLPIFLCEQLQSAQIFPVFLDPADVAKTWVAAGRDKETVPQDLKCMDLRTFIAMMQKPDNPWRLVQFIGSQGAIELAVEQQQLAEGGGAAAAPAAAKAPIPEADEEDDLLLNQEEEEEI